MTRPSTNDVRADARRLLGSDIDNVERIRGGGNNEIFRISAAGAQFALKRYLETAGDTRDRIGHEFDGLRLLAAAGETAVPHPIAADRSGRVALYEWIPGESIDELGSPEIDECLAFLARVHACRTAADAGLLPPAVEACLSADSLRAQVGTRLSRLADAGASEPLLATYLTDVFQPAWRAIETRLGAGETLARDRQTLSPSDFGRHNMLRRPDRRLVFLDFEYFGWDDPVKLIADIVWHPGSSLDPAAQARFVAGARLVFGDDPAYPARFSRYAPAFGLRWALIVLSEFFPERWERRRRAGHTGSWAAAKARQLAKARDLTTRALAALDT